jgi:putative FmdB family regulatory protein
MPLYDYGCPHCGFVFEDVWLRLSEWAETVELTCPGCGPVEARFLFRGSNVDDWGPGRFYPHVSPEGKTFHSRRQFKRYLRDHGLRETDSYVD